MMISRLFGASLGLFLIAAASAAENSDGPDDQEQYFICMVNRARTDPAAEAKRLGIDLNEGLKTSAISADPKQPLAVDPGLMSAARDHSRWMLQNNKLSHDQSGKSPQQRMQSAGYPFEPTYGSAENLGFTGQTGQAKDAIAAMEEIHDGLFLDRDVAGRGHRINLLRDDYRQTGVGVIQGSFRMDDKQFASYILTQDFAVSAAKPESYLTGVVYADQLKPDRFYTPGEGAGGVRVEARRARDGKSFATTTWKSGGYSLQLPSGQYRLTASGGTLPGKIDGDTVTISDRNVLLDFVAK